MEASTTIEKMLANNQVFVPNYQRAYSWETEMDSSKPPKHINQFLQDLEDYNRSKTSSKYYFGHFLFEKLSDNRFAIIDGQQRLTTIMIFLSALFAKLETIRPLSEDEETSKENMIIMSSVYRFKTVDYDNQLFIDYVITQRKKNKNNLKTQSAKRITEAFDYFESYFDNKDDTYLSNMLNIIKKASCTTHPVTDESEAIQMFIFQNNRGKKPSNLEIIKAQLMFNIHLYADDEKENLLNEIKNRFEEIYKSISLVEKFIKEDDVLTYTLRVYFNSLWEQNALDRINKVLSDESSINFIKEFTHALSTSFECLTRFYTIDEPSSLEIHSLIVLGRIGIILPFIIKAYDFGLTIEEIKLLCRNFESIVLRHRLIGTRADITSRLNSVYKNFTLQNPNISPILNRIEHLKSVASDNYWWSYWNNEQLERSIQEKINSSSAKYLLWKYENYIENQGKKGYMTTRYDKIESPELEHIAPVTENPLSGYDIYDDEFRNELLDCLGNYLLISKSHNCSVGNKPFKEKRETYTHLEQQREIRRMTIVNELWTKELIKRRKDKIVNFIMSEL